MKKQSIEDILGDNCTASEYSTQSVCIPLVSNMKLDNRLENPPLLDGVW